MEQEKIFENHISDKELTSTICKEFIKFNSKSPNILIKKNGRGNRYFFSQRRHTNNQQIYEKIINIISYLGNANRNHDEISTHICQNGYYQKTRDNKCQ